MARRHAEFSNSASAAKLTQERTGYSQGMRSISPDGRYAYMFLIVLEQGYQTSALKFDDMTIQKKQPATPWPMKLVKASPLRRQV
jgi:hypothetical protein